MTNRLYGYYKQKSKREPPRHCWRCNQQMKVTGRTRFKTLVVDGKLVHQPEHASQYCAREVYENTNNA